MTTLIDLDEVIASFGPDDPARFVAIADHFLQRDERAAAAVALDRAYGLAPATPGLAAHRAGILDQLAVDDHGLAWRYVPAGTFLMGSTTGDPDERPVHPRRVDAFWILDAPIAWGPFARLLGWTPPPRSGPPAPVGRDASFALTQRNKIRMQYCEATTVRARDWHAHAGIADPGATRDAGAALDYDTKPLVAASVDEATQLAARLSTDTVRYALPTEAQWEKAARGGLVGRRFAWGDARPTARLADFDRMGDFRLRDPRELPPNGYGVYGMCGGVAELTGDRYDALAYRHHLDGANADEGGELPVIRGGSWIDCADAITVSFRATAGRRGRMAITPTIGFRLVRQLRTSR